MKKTRFTTLILALLLILSSAAFAYAKDSGNNGQENSGGQDGSGGSSASRYDSNGSSIPRDPGTGRDFVWYVDLGSGSWDVDGRTISAKRNGSAVSGVVDLRFNDGILLDGFSGSDARAYLIAADGSRIELQANGDGEVAVGRHIPKDAYVPFKVSLLVERASGGASNGPDDLQRYKVDMAGGSWDVDGKEVYVTVNGSRVSGTVELAENDVIRIHGIDRDMIDARIYSDDGYSAVLEINGDDEVSLARSDRPDAAIPGSIRFTIEKRADAPEEQDSPDNGSAPEDNGSAPEDKGAAEENSGPEETEPRWNEPYREKVIPLVPILIIAAAALLIVIIAVLFLIKRKKKR